MTLTRTDYAFPLEIDGSSSQAARAPYPAHVDQMLRQLLLTNPGERTCLPRFGCGLRRLVFSPQTAGLAGTVQIHIQNAIEQWLADQVKLTKVTVLAGADPANGLDQGEFLVTVAYTLLDALEPRELELILR